MTGPSSLSTSNSRGPSETTPRNTPQTATFAERPNRLKSRDEGIVRWPELLEKFKNVQEKARKARKGPLYAEDERREDDEDNVNGNGGANALRRNQDVTFKEIPQPPTAGAGAGASNMPGRAGAGPSGTGGQQQPILHKSRGSLGGLKNLAKGVAKGKRG